MDERGVGRDEAAAFLVGRYGAMRVEAVEALGSGEWSRAFSFRLDGRDLVARFGGYREDFETDQRAMAFDGPDLPVPRVLEIGDAFGGAFAISERHRGAFLEALDAPTLRLLLPALLRTLDALRAVPQDRSGTPWREWLVASLVDQSGARVSGWRATLAQSPEVEEVFVAGELALRSLAGSCPELGHVLHGDLINRNVLVAEDGSRIVAVFDWGSSKRGDFLYEIAFLRFWAPWFPSLAAIDIRVAVLEHYAQIGLDVPDLDARLRAYELQIGLEHIAYNAFKHRSDEAQARLAREVRARL